MVAVAQGAASTAVAPLLSIRTTDGTRIVDPDDGTLTFTVVDISTERKEMVPVTSTSGTVDLTDDRIGTATGYFAAVFTMSGSEPLGAHEIRWAWEVDGVAFSQTQRFDVFEGVPRGLGGGYILVSDLRSEGIGKGDANDLRLLKLIKEWSGFFDMATGRWFEPRYLDKSYDGFGSKLITFDNPIIAIERVTTYGTDISLTVADDAVAIYNRHITGGPDDREIPRIEFKRTVSFYDDDQWDNAFSSDTSDFQEGGQVVSVAGLFGYTDYDGSAYGATPDMVKRAIKLLVIRAMSPMGCSTSSVGSNMASAVTSLRTREQSVTWSESAVKSSGATGVREIDVIIAAYRRPMGVAGV